MASNLQTFQELQALREELSSGRRGASLPAAKSPPPAQSRPEIAEPAAREPETEAAPKGAGQRGPLSEELDELVGELTQFFEEAEKNIAAQPAASAVGALVVGMIVGWMIRRPSRR